MGMASNSKPEVLRRARAELSKSSMETVDGVAYLTYTQADVPSLLKRVREEPLRHSDIINTGHPRSGNHWMMEIVEMILRGNSTYTKDVFRTRLLESRLAGIEQKTRELVAMADPRLLVSHCRFSRLPAQIAEKKVKVVYVLRNPKDAIWSWYRLRSTFKRDEDKFHGTWEEFFELELTGELPWGSWFDNVLDFENFRHAHPDVPVFIAQYEKFKSNPEKEIRRLVTFLGHPEAPVSDIAKAVEFEAMKSGTMDKMSESQKICLSDSSKGFFVKGQVMDWKNHFTVDMSERFDREFDERMAGSQVANLVREFIRL